MRLKQWEDLPEKMKNDKVLPYYDIYDIIKRKQQVCYGKEYLIFVCQSCCLLFYLGSF